LPPGSSQFRKQGSLPAARRTSYQFFGDLLARFAVLPTACRKWPGHRHPPVLRIAKYPGDWERGNLTKCGIKICFSPIKPFQILQRTCLVRLLVPNLSSYKRLANDAVKVIIAKRIKQVRSAGSTAPRNRRTDRLSRCCSRPSPSACRHSRRRDNCRRFCRQGSYSQTCSATPRRP
jgi:hypothetical protein